MAGLHLPRWLSRCGVLSRKAAEQAVVDGRVAVDGRICRDVLRTVQPGRSRVTLDGAPVVPADKVWLALHKPRGVVTTTRDPEGRPTVMDALGPHAGTPGLAPVGRLDLDSQGLLLLTNDHVAAAALLDPARHVRKLYRVKVAGWPPPDALARLTAGGMSFPDLEVGPLDAVTEIRRNPASTWLEIALSEGKNRQIRRMCEAIGHPVETLIRVGFGPVALGGLGVGAVRVLTGGEIERLGKEVG